jgi:hypothetical protein
VARPLIRPWNPAAGHAFVDYACEWEPIPDDGLERYAEGKPR